MHKTIELILFIIKSKKPVVRFAFAHEAGFATGSFTSSSSAVCENKKRELQF